MDIRNNYTSIEQIQGQYLNNNSKSIVDSGAKNVDFANIFAEKIEEKVKFSKHADARLAMRNINLSDEQMGRLCEGIEKAGEKGIKESLVLVDDLAFIVNIKNNTVITAMDGSNSNEKVFTNIDGAVIV